MERTEPADFQPGVGDRRDLPESPEKRIMEEVDVEILVKQRQCPLVLVPYGGR